jgi:outer membrane receptor protein involved in Fe transport
VLPASAQALVQHYQLNIPRQSLDTALKDFAAQTGLQVARMSDAVDGSALVGPVTGDLSVEEALSSLLTPRGLTYKRVNDRTIAIYKKEGAATRAESLGTGGSALGEQSVQASPTQGATQEKSVSEQAAPARADQSQTAGPERSLSSQGRLVEPVVLQEVVVTAQKREERLQDVPIAMTALNTEALADAHQTTLLNYFNQVPALTAAPTTLAGTTLAIRGITTGSGAGTGSATVGVLLDDVPMGSSGSNLFPDFDPGELARIEVLRGPQGTLYGVSTLGGLIKYVTQEPTHYFTARVQADTNTVYNGVDPGYAFRGSVSGPLTDDLGIRASAFTRRDAGYIDNPLLGTEGVNQTYAYGGHLSAVWRPTDTVSLKLSALYQYTWAGSTSDIVVGQGLGDLQQSYISNGSWFNRSFAAYSAIFDVKLGTFDLTSLTGYNLSVSHNNDDFTNYYGSLASSFNPPLGSQYSGTPITTASDTSVFSQELRIAGPVGRLFDVRLGLFYTYQDNSNYQAIQATNPTTGAVGGTAYFAPAGPNTYEEYAAFGDLTLHATDKLDFQVGGRFSKIKNITGPSTITSIFGIPSAPSSTFRDQATTFLVTGEYKFTPNLMSYARVASGYRGGGENLPPEPGVPPTFGPDKTTNYEIGAKGDLIGKYLSVDASLYYIDWTNLQVGLASSQGTGYTANAGNAVSKGLELSVQSRPILGLTISAWGAFARAEVTTLPPVCPPPPTPNPGGCLNPGSPLVGSIGQPLPWAPHVSGNVSATYEFPLGSSFAGSVGGAATHIGDRKDNFVSPNTPPRQDLPAYTQIDLRAGLKHGPWTTRLYVNNVADRRGVISGGNSSANFPPGSTYLITPRTIGLSVVRDF